MCGQFVLWRSVKSMEGIKGEQIHEYYNRKFPEAPLVAGRKYMQLIILGETEDGSYVKIKALKSKEFT